MKWEKRKGMNVLKHYPYGYSNIGVCGDLGFLLFMYLTLSCFDGFLFTRIWIRKFTTTTCSITYLQRYCPNFWSFAQISCFHIMFFFFSKFHFYTHLPCRSGNFSHLCSYQYICLFFPETDPWHQICSFMNIACWTNYNSSWTAKHHDSRPDNCHSYVSYWNKTAFTCMVQIEGNNANADDAIMLDKDGFVSETNATNIVSLCFVTVSDVRATFTWRTIRFFIKATWNDHWQLVRWFSLRKILALINWSNISFYITLNGLLWRVMDIICDIKKKKKSWECR